MSFTSGTVKSINEFMDAMAAYAVANESWVILQGSENQSDSGAYPLNSQYYRLEFDDPTGGQDMELAALEFRATAGGADYGLDIDDVQDYSGDQNGNGPSRLFDGDATTNWELNPGFSTAWIEFDLGSAQLLRQIVLTVDDSNAGHGPTTIRLYRSEDGVYWDNVYEWLSLSWSVGEVKLLTLPADASFHNTTTASGGVRRPCRYWLQGPGYDADRRVYVGFELFQDFTDGNQGFRMQGTTLHDAATDFDNQINAVPFSRTPYFVIDNSGEDIDYWLYVNSLRIYAVLRSGAGDYAHFYAGFLSCFADPDQHTNPLFLGGTSPQIGDSDTLDFLLWNEADSRNSAPWDPGNWGAVCLDYKGDWINVVNNQTVASIGRRPYGLIGDEAFFVFPFHLGACSGGSLSAGYSLTGSSTDTNGDHFLKNCVPTLQDEIPIFDVIVQSPDYGHIGKMQGLITFPAAGLTVEQTITISSQDYRCFYKRTSSDEAQWIGIEEL